MSGYSLLLDAYDKMHRGRRIAEDDAFLSHFHLRSARVDGPSTPKRPKMQYDERYTNYIRRTRLLPFIQLASRGMSKMNPLLSPHLLTGGALRHIPFTYCVCVGGGD